MCVSHYLGTHHSPLREVLIEASRLSVKNMSVLVSTRAAAPLLSEHSHTHILPPLMLRCRSAGCYTLGRPTPKLVTPKSNQCGLGAGTEALEGNIQPTFVGDARCVSALSTLILKIQLI